MIFSTFIYIYLINASTRIESNRRQGDALKSCQWLGRPACSTFGIRTKTFKAITPQGIIQLQLADRHTFRSGSGSGSGYGSGNGSGSGAGKKQK